MSWIPSNERLPGAGTRVKMKWADGETEWTGNIFKELEDIKPTDYNILVWWDEGYYHSKDDLITAFVGAFNSGLRHGIKHPERTLSTDATALFDYIKSLGL